MSTDAIHYRVLADRRDYVRERIISKRRVGWETAHDQAELEALNWALLEIDDAGQIRDGFAGSVTRKLDDILTRLNTVITQESRTMATVKDLQDKAATLQKSVEAETDLDTSILTFVQGQNDMLIDLKKQLADAIAAGGTDPAALQAVVDQLDAITTLNDANAARIAAAIVTNTPAAPPAA